MKNKQDQKLQHVIMPAEKAERALSLGKIEQENRTVVIVSIGPVFRAEFDKIAGVACRFVDYYTIEPPKPIRAVNDTPRRFMQRKSALRTFVEWTVGFAVGTVAVIASGV